MPEPLSVGIVLPSNTIGGPQKLSAIMAADLAQEGHHVTIFASVLPHYYYYVTLGKRPIPWLKYVLHYVKAWALDRKFFFKELLEDAKVSGQVRFRFVPRSASKKQLNGLDCLVYHSIAQVEEYRNKFPQNRQIYLLHHLEEHNHGSREIFKQARRSFAGSILVVSPFTAREVAPDAPNASMVVNPISLAVWAQRDTFDADAGRRDILLFWKDYAAGLKGRDIVLQLQSMRPEATVTVWCRGSGNRALAEQALPGATIVEQVSEKQLIDLYLGHSFLLFCSTFEGFGMPPIEALACGCIPVLNPDVGAAELYARDGQNVIFLDEDAATVAGRLAGALNDPSALQAMRLAGSASIEAFNPDRYGQRLLEAAGFL